MIRQVFYTSDAVGDDRTGDLKEILACARRNNPELELTGFLLVDGGRFMQFVEGDDEFLGPTLQLIATDRRHEGMRILLDRQVRMRCFPDWTMGYLKPDDNPTARAAIDSWSQRDIDVPQLIETLRRLPWHDAPTAA